MEKTNLQTDKEINDITVDKQTFKDGSICGYDSLHTLLSANLKPHIFQVFNNSSNSFSVLLEFCALDHYWKEDDLFCFFVS